MARRLGTLPGLPSLRLALVLVVVAFQSVEVSENWVAVMSTPLWLVQALALPGLFAATGFMLASSRSRQGWRGMLGRRARRVLPVTVIAITATALALGALMTTLPTSFYFTDPSTWLYFANLAAVPVHELPGVFEFNNVPRTVSTIVAVFPIYIVLVATALIPEQPRWGRALIVGLILAAGVASLGAEALGALPFNGREFTRFALGGPGLGMLVSGLIGVLFHLARKRVPLGAPLAWAAAAFLGLLMLVGNAGWSSRSLFWIVTAPAVAYLTIYLANVSLPLARLSERARPILLPLLLFSYPLQQTVIELGPRNQNLFENLGLVAVPLIVVAVASRVLTRFVDRADPKVVSDRMAELGPDNVGGRKRRLRSRLQDAAGVLGLSAVVGVFAVLVMSMLFLAFSRG